MHKAYLHLVSFRGNKVALVVKYPPTSAGDIKDTSLIPGSGICPGGRRNNPLQYPCLENPMDRGAWGYSSGLHIVRHD